MQTTETLPPEQSIWESSSPAIEELLFVSARIFVACWVLFYLIRGASLAFWFDGAPGDGPFQMFNPLRRIAAGQVGGRDFVFYHGIGVPYLHYPLFALLGGKTLAASELSRQWMSLLLFVLSLGFFIRATFRRISQVWIASAVAVLLMEAVFPLGPAPG